MKENLELIQQLQSKSPNFEAMKKFGRGGGALEKVGESGSIKNGLFDAIAIGYGTLVVVVHRYFMGLILGRHHHFAFFLQHLLLSCFYFIYLDTPCTTLRLTISYKRKYMTSGCVKFTNLYYYYTYLSYVHHHDL